MYLRYRKEKKQQPKVYTYLGIYYLLNYHLVIPNSIRTFSSKRNTNKIGSKSRDGITIHINLRYYINHH